jgi:hypothetical protein
MINQQIKTLWTPRRERDRVGSMARGSRSSDSWTRERLALVVVGSSFLCILLIAGAAIALADRRGPTARDVFTALLPVLGTWVGTVLAFYFARENLEAATNSTLALTGGREPETPVTKVMIPEADFIALDLGAEEKLEDVPLTRVRARMKEDSPPSRRVPIRDSAHAVLCVIHDSTLGAYADSKQLSIDNLGELTVGDMLGDEQFGALLKANGYVGKTATVGDARIVMSSIDKCNDVFVTETGKAEERAIGWLTNTLLAGIQ